MICLKVYHVYLASGETNNRELVYNINIAEIDNT